MRNSRVCTPSSELSYNGLHVGLNCAETILLASVPLEKEGWEPLEGGNGDWPFESGKELARVVT